MDSNDRERLKRDFVNGRIPFALDKRVYHPFSERDVIFSRVWWDKSFLAFGRRISEREIEMVDRKGYSRIGYASSSASWMVHNNLVREFQRVKTGNPSVANPYVQDQASSGLPKYESVDVNLTTDRIKRLGQIFGACDVGVATIDAREHFVYSHDRRGERVNLSKRMKYVIVMLIQMDYYALLTSPRLPASITVGNAYSRAAFASGCMAETIRNLGYQAIPSVNSMGLSVPLAVLAGLGEFGRNGLLIHPKFGQAIRIAKVFTDLPLTPDSPITFGAVNFCRLCKKCAKFCPSRSISDGEPTWESPWDTPSNNNGVYKWYVNADTCYDFWIRNSTDCSNCVRVCPFTKPPGLLHDVVRFFIGNFPILNRIWIKLDYLMGYGNSKEADKFWTSETYLNEKVTR